MSDTKSYKQGLVDGVALWGRVCGKQGNCEVCPIGSVRGANVTCQDFATQFPAKMVSILTEMDNSEITYFEEYTIRFPECNLPIETLANCACRKAVFEGDLSCTADSEEQCIACWNEIYTGDVTSEGDE